MLTHERWLQLFAPKNLAALPFPRPVVAAICSEDVPEAALTKGNAKAVPTQGNGAAPPIWSIPINFLDLIDESTLGAIRLALVPAMNGADPASLSSRAFVLNKDALVDALVGFLQVVNMATAGKAFCAHWYETRWATGRACSTRQERGSRGVDPALELSEVQ